MSETEGPGQIGFDLEGPRVTVRTLIAAAQRFVGMMEAIDAEVCEGRPAFDWVITEMSAGSAHVRARPSPLRRGVRPAAGRRIVRTARQGIEAIRAGKPRPRGFPESAVLHLMALTELVRQERLERIAIRADNVELPITATLQAQIAAQVEAKEEVIGSVEGRLETITIHGQEHFNVYDELTGRAVRCFFRPDQLPTIMGAFTKRVLVFGQMYLTPSGDRESIRVRDVRVLRDASELTPVDAIRGVLRDA